MARFTSVTNEAINQTARNIRLAQE